jgi:hypothetical protein
MGMSRSWEENRLSGTVPGRLAREALTMEQAARLLATVEASSTYWL